MKKFQNSMDNMVTEDWLKDQDRAGDADKLADPAVGGQADKYEEFRNACKAQTHKTLGGRDTECQK